jgi:predicted RNase H-like nuclease
MEPTVSRVAGVDGCRGGWVVATADTSGGHVDVTVVAAVAPVVAAVRDGTLAALAIDMPIGLAAHGARRADTEARALLGPRRSSLFPTPPRAVLAATEYADALARCRAATGKGMSRQAFHLLPKIRELADALEPALQPRVSEVHPETSFAVLRGAPCAWPKRTPAGVTERLAALRVAFPATDLDALVARPPRGAASDDVLDAVVAAWTARRIAAGCALVLGDADARDPMGYRLTITA